MFDKEIEAIAKCTELVKDLDEESKYRVLKYLIERFGIGPKEKQAPNFSYQSSDIVNDAILIANVTDNIPKEQDNNVDNNDYPSLKDLVVKNYPKNEVEWILCYAFFASKHGTDTFTKDSIVSLYNENKRFSTSAKANLSNNINSCIKKDWLKTHNDDFILKEEGLKYAKEVLGGKSTSKEVKVFKKKPAQLQTEE